MNTPAKRSLCVKNPRAPAKCSRTAGGGAKAAGANKFSLLVEDEMVIATVAPVVSLTSEDTGKWGEDEYVPNPCTDRWIREVESTYWDHKPIVYETVEKEEEEKDWADMEQELWSQPFAAHLEMKSAAQDVFDCQDLTEEAYADFMTFLYLNGWDVIHEERRFVQATTGSEPPRVWIPPSVKPTIPIFCMKARDCFVPGCRYVHADIIYKINDECKFGEDCGASDPSGAKRALCIRIHPGEVWSPDLCVHRL
jgi:hypothetical protein